ncbi:hypothetical protein [Micromonospora sp. DT62]|uniref:hypothetical protein n=1 Tax=Micromonospora sp. DT62 TaxID=3416521 RepID=UPI003CF9AC23
MDLLDPDLLLRDLVHGGIRAAIAALITRLLGGYRPTDGVRGSGARSDQDEGERRSDRPAPKRPS